MKSIQDIMKDLPVQAGNRARYQEHLRDLMAYPAIRKFLQANRDRINQDYLQASISKLNEFMTSMKTYEAAPAEDKPAFVPSLVLGRHYIDVAYHPTEAFLQARKQAEMGRLLNNRMMSKDVRQASLKDIEWNTPERKALMQEVLNFVEAYEAGQTGLQGLYVSGPFGVGKTYIFGALANRLVESHHSVTMIHYPTFVQDMKEAINTKNVQSLLDKVKQVDVLFIDDIGAEANTPWVRDEILNILLEYRMKESLPTFFTSNFNLRELEQHLANVKGGVEATKAARIMERIKYLAKETTLSGANRRQMGRS
ncbi:primosomal protein DnaI [Eremococcus coleocola]|uniref:primosomal protein DnaI n=1 Tax=Eremococcus coleocola TaxID=88132 RepID=UPI0003F92D1E|nr:primosomal protein DnaI [Eremococcus coleocola]